MAVAIPRRHWERRRDSTWLEAAVAWMRTGQGEYGVEMGEAARVSYVLTVTECCPGEQVENALDAANCGAGIHVAKVVGRSQHSECLRCQLPRLPRCFPTCCLLRASVSELSRLTIGQILGP